MISGYGKSCEDAMQVSDIWETPGPTEEQVQSCGEERGGIDGHGRVSKGSGQDLDPRSDWDPVPSKMSTCFLSLGSYELLDPGGGRPQKQHCLEEECAAAAATAPPIYYSQVIIAIFLKCGLPH